jgi:hypothetical protein
MNDVAYISIGDQFIINGDNKTFLITVEGKHIDKFIVSIIVNSQNGIHKTRNKLITEEQLCKITKSANIFFNEDLFDF